jgi:hypothetical protein
MAYSGQFYPKFPKKYKGNHTNIIWRSLWEKAVMHWFDENPSVIEWSSEEIIIPYICRTDNRQHRYFCDFLVKFTSGITMLIEVKPDSQIRKPEVIGKKVSKTLIESVTTYAKNVSKWEAAEAYCKKNGWTFQIWGETALKRIGIKYSTNPTKNK